MKEYLLSIGFEQQTSWLFIDESYQITQLVDDSLGFEMWSIINKRFDERVFRGRIRSVEEFKQVFMLVKEDYDLTDEEINKLKIGE